MKINFEIHNCLGSINHALLSGNQIALEEALNSSDLEILLSQKTIDITRALHRTPLTVFLCTLAIENGIEVISANKWLTCYKSIFNKQLEADLENLPQNNIIRIAVDFIIQQNPYLNSFNLKTKGSSISWKIAFELLFDHKNWTGCLYLLKVMSKKSLHKEYWTGIFESIFDRHAIYSGNQIGARSKNENIEISKIYLYCADNAYKARLFLHENKLRHLAARSLESAADLNGSIKILENLDPQNISPAIQKDIARIYCKEQKYEKSIKKLDHVLKILTNQNISSENSSQHTNTYKKNSHSTFPFDINKASWALRDFINISNSKSVQVFLVSGTLLGFEREGQLLKHDKDIDVGILDWQSQFILCSALLESGLFSISTQHLKGKDTIYIPIRHKATGMWMDIFIYHPKGNKWVTGVDFFFGYRQTFAFTPFELKDIYFLGVSMKAPKNADLNLTENYGNWRTPDESYLSHLESPSTVDKGGLVYMIAARLAAIDAFLNKQPLKLQKVLRLMRIYEDMPGSMSKALIHHLNDSLLDKNSSSLEKNHG